MSANPTPIPAMPIRDFVEEKQACHHIAFFFLRSSWQIVSTMIAGTLQTDPRSGGIKKSSGVKVLPAVAEGECDPVPSTQPVFRVE